jgi:predicted alpha/beta hydrolase family esterase
MHATCSGDVATVEPRVRLARNPVVYCHSAFGSTEELTGLDAIEHPCKALVRHGFSVIAATLPMEHWWGTAGGVTTTRRLIDRHRTTLSGTGPAVLYATSMGAATAIQTAAVAEPGDVACIVLAAPCLDLEHQRRASALGPYINAAWGKTPIESNVDPLPKGANPIDRAREIAAIPVLLMYASDDDISSGYDRFAEAHGSTTLVDLGSTGHSMETLHAIDPGVVAEFVEAHA